jgi:hypothetical protein
MAEPQATDLSDPLLCGLIGHPASCVYTDPFLTCNEIIICASS